MKCNGSDNVNCELCWFRADEDLFLRFFEISPIFSARIFTLAVSSLADLSPGIIDDIFVDSVYQDLNHFVKTESYLHATGSVHAFI